MISITFALDSMRRGISFFIFFIIVFAAYAQSVNPNEYEEHKPLLYRNEFSYGLTVHTAGWGIDFRRGFHNTGMSKTVFETEFLSIRNAKEIRTVNPYVDGARAYVYGKMNYLNVLRFGIGEQRTLYGKSERGGIAIQLNYTGGLSLGFAMPVYLQIVNDPPNQYNTVIVKYNPELHSVDKIVGRGPLFRGIGETKFYPGIYGKIGFNFDWNKNDDKISSLEAGLMVDVFAKRIPVMAFTENNLIYFNFYITILFGYKWYTN